jgi:hypothetical protein
MFENYLYLLASPTHANSWLLKVHKPASFTNDIDVDECAWSVCLIWRSPDMAAAGRATMENQLAWMVMDVDVFCCSMERVLRWSDGDMEYGGNAAWCFYKKRGYVCSLQSVSLWYAPFCSFEVNPTASSERHSSELWCSRKKLKVRQQVIGSWITELAVLTSLFNSQ